MVNYNCFSRLEKRYYFITIQRH